MSSSTWVWPLLPPRWRWPAPTGTIVSLLARQPAHGLPLLAVSALCTWLTYLVISVLAELQAARRLTAIDFRSEP